jgi:glycosyltransferase involved in cell wall biosynthesis
MEPRISAIVPVYNGREYLRQAVDSIVCQTLPSCELILVDDGSTDGSMDVVADVKAVFPIVRLRQENAGQSAARNHGARAAQGDFFAFLDQDDWWYPEHLERLWRPLRAGDRPRLGWVYSNLDEYDIDGNLIDRKMLDLQGAAHPKEHLAEILTHDMFVLPSASLIRREAFESVGGFWEALSGYEDDDLFLRLFRRGWENVYIEDSLSAWRINETSASYSPRMDRSRRIYADRLLASFPDEPWRGRYWVWDCIAPRFFLNAMGRYQRAMREEDDAECRASLDEARYYWRRMEHGRKMAVRLRLMRYPQIYRILASILKQVPSGLRRRLGLSSDRRPYRVLTPSKPEEHALINWRGHEPNVLELEADSMHGLIKMRDTHRSRFLIIGAQRSGTTLMRLILECHSQIESYDEGSSYKILAGQREADRRKPLIVLKVPQFTEQLAQPFLRDDAAILARERGVKYSYDGEELIFMIRDARDTVASMLGLKSWLTLFGDPILESKINNDSAFANRYAAEIAIAGASSYYQVARAALIWRYKTDSLWHYIDRRYRVLPVRYETLVKWPRRELTNVCRFLSVSFESSLLRHESVPHSELNADGMAIGNTNPKRSINDASVGQWRQRFSTPEIDEILRIAGNTQARLYPDETLAASNENYRTLTGTTAR